MQYHSHKIYSVNLCIQSKYRKIQTKKKLHIWTLLTQCLSFQVPCELSIFPWTCGWYTQDVTCWIPLILKNTFTAPWYSVSRSLWTLLGGPIHLNDKTAFYGFLQICHVNDIYIAGFLNNLKQYFYWFKFWNSLIWSLVSQNKYYRETKLRKSQKTAR